MGEERLLLGYRAELADLLAEYGFQFSEVAPIFRGRMIVLRRNEDLFLIIECDILVVELILKDADRYWQVYCHTAIWHCGVRELKKATTLENHLSLLKKHLPHCCGALLTGDLSALDMRYCSPIEDIDGYLRSLR